ncbi:unnamed protein product [Withania somnifera]
MRVRCYHCTLFIAHGLMYTCPIFLTLFMVCQFESIFFMLSKGEKGNRLIPSLRRTNQGLKLVHRARGENYQQGFHTLCKFFFSLPRICLE